jgi:hypothetical protein
MYTLCMTSTRTTASQQRWIDDREKRGYGADIVRTDGAAIIVQSGGREWRVGSNGGVTVVEYETRQEQRSRETDSWESRIEARWAAIRAQKEQT